MRILLLSRSEITRSPRGRALAKTLVAVGHEVVAVCGGAGKSLLPGVDIRRVPTRVPRRWGRVGWSLRRIQPAAFRHMLFERSFKRAATAVDADLIYPIGRRDLETATEIASSSQAILREPQWPSAGDRDVVDLAPDTIELSSSPAGKPLPFHTTADTRVGRRPAKGRHSGVRVTFAYQRTKTTPAQYLESAAERAGMVVDRHDGALDWNDIHPETAAVVFVESPYPAIEVRGRNDHGVPVLYWVHHGEHHLPANLRLSRRYGAHAVLLAHSWHLAHRFPIPVHRFPFAVAPEIFAGNRPFEERRKDVAMIGAGVEGGGGRYARRQHLVAALKHQYPHSSSFVYGVSPDEMACLYGDSRIVLNEGGDRHHPVTMRVFEAIGSGAFLVTDDAPGLGILFHPRSHYAEIVDDITTQVGDLLADPSIADRAAAAHSHAMEHHLYDHRIDDLVEIAAQTTVFGQDTIIQPSSIAGLIEDDLDVQEIALFGIDYLFDQLGTHVLWDGPTLVRTSRSRTVDAVVLGPDYQHRVDIAAERATRFVYAFAAHQETLERLALSRWPDATCTYTDGVLRVDLGAKSYRVRAAGHPLAGA